MIPQSKIAAGIAELDQGLEALFVRIQTIEQEGGAVAKRISDACTRAMERFGRIREEFEESGSWKVQLEEALNIEKQLADRMGERYELRNIVSSIEKESKVWEVEQRLVISEAKNGSGKNRYTNDPARAAAMIQIKTKDSDWAAIRDRIQDAEMQVLAFDIETKKLEAEAKSKWAYIRMIEARLHSISFR